MISLPSFFLEEEQLASNMTDIHTPKYKRVFILSICFCCYFKRQRNKKKGRYTTNEKRNEDISELATAYPYMGKRDNAIFKRVGKYQPISAILIGNITY